MQSKIGVGIIAGWTAAAATTAAFAKSFVPFYLIGSTVIFATASALAIGLVVSRWRQIYDDAKYVPNVLVLLALLYVTVVVGYFSNSFPAVPVTYLLGILIFHGLFLALGFAAARALKVVLLLLLAAAVIYAIVIAQYVAQFGDLMKHGYLHDIFGVRDPLMFGTFHQNIGISMGLATLAALGLGSTRTLRFLAVVACPLVLLFMFHIAARGAMFALVCSLIFLAIAALSLRSRRLALLTVTAAIVAATLASSIFYQYAIRNKDVDARAPDAISRTIREIQNPDPLFRAQIWARAWHRIETEPAHLLFGRGIGTFPIDEGFGAPDWLVRRTEGSKHYPHNIHLEMLYETGMTGLVLFSILTLLPLASALKRWQLFSLAERSVISLYVFTLAGSEISGAFAFSYDLLFFFGLSVGIIALKRKDEVVAADIPGAGSPLSR